MQRTIKAVFMRGGTSKGLFFHKSDLPADAGDRDSLITAAMGSPDLHGRQLDGMGGGISSLSKVMIVESSARKDVDVEFTFGQVFVDEPVIHYDGTCGNLSAAVAAFAVDEGLVRPPDGATVLRMVSANTGKLVRAGLEVKDGRAAVGGDFAIDGVSGTGAKIRLDFLDPGGSAGGALLPTGAPADEIEVPGVGRIAVSIVDAATPVVFVKAGALGLSGSERPDELNADRGLLNRLEAIRTQAQARAGAIELGISMVAAAPPAGPADFVLRAISMGAPHKAIPVTAAMCAAVAAKIEGTVVHDLARRPAADGTITIGHPAGVCPVDAEVSNADGWQVGSLTVFRTARRLMSGLVYAGPLSD